MARPDYDSQLDSSRSGEEFVQPALSYIGKSSMMHFNNVEVGRWKGMISFLSFIASIVYLFILSMKV